MARVSVAGSYLPTRPPGWAAGSAFAGSLAGASLRVGRVGTGSNGCVAAMVGEVVRGALCGIVHSHERHELFREVLVSAAIVSQRVPDPQPRAQHMGELVRQRPHEARILGEPVLVVTDERIVAQEKMIERVDVESPIATPGGNGLEACRKVVQRSNGLAVEQGVARQERDGGKRLCVRSRAREVLGFQEIFEPIERVAAGVVDDRERLRVRRRLGRQGAGRAPLDDLHMAVRQPYRRAEPLRGAGERVDAGDRRAAVRRGRHECHDGDGRHTEEPGNAGREYGSKTAVAHAVKRPNDSPAFAGRHMQRRPQSSFRSQPV